MISDAVTSCSQSPHKNSCEWPFREGSCNGNAPVVSSDGDYAELLLSVSRTDAFDTSAMLLLLMVMLLVSATSFHSLHLHAQSA